MTWIKNALDAITSIESFDDLTTTGNDEGAAVITRGTEDSITLESGDHANLTANEFIFGSA
ncbi:MAG: hypothetical protein GDA52_07505 [Rhodobacteraceae bacterium]|nr:hypothetical protein [Paracoccaceae bacterium]